MSLGRSQCSNFDYHKRRRLDFAKKKSRSIEKRVRFPSTDESPLSILEECGKNICAEDKNNLILMGESDYETLGRKDPSLGLFYCLGHWSDSSY